MSSRFAIAVHGGAGRWPRNETENALVGVRRAVEAALQVLSKGGAALDAAVAAVVILEDDPNFNAGTGSALNLAGEAEMDALVMNGEDLRCGGVAAIRHVKNPILVAKKVMQETDHVLLVGDGAQRFAREMGFADHDPITAKRRDEFQKRVAKIRTQRDAALPRLASLIEAHPSLSQGTVGAVALDMRGCLAAATSTGGLTLKLPGRVGDSPIPGAGTYATPHAAASATGAGEAVLRTTATRAVCDLITTGDGVQSAVAHALSRIRDLGAEAGMIAMDTHGVLGVAHTTAAMPHAFRASGHADITARMST